MSSPTDTPLNVPPPSQIQNTENTPLSPPRSPRSQSIFSKKAKIWFSLRAYDIKTGRRNTAPSLIKAWNATNQEQYDHTDNATQTAVLRIIANQENKGTILTKSECTQIVKHKPRGKYARAENPVVMMTTEAEKPITDHFDEFPEWSYRKRAEVLGWSEKIVRKVAKKYKYSSYKLRKHQVLTAAHIAMRFAFATLMMLLIDTGELFWIIERIWWTDECMFAYNMPYINTQNTRYLVTGGIERVPVEWRDQGGTVGFPKSVHVWGAICKGKRPIIKFLTGSINGNKYHRLLVWFLNLQVVRSMTDPYFMQDGASVHRTNKVISYLRRKLPLRTLMLLMLLSAKALRIPEAKLGIWPPHSPDMNPCMLV